MCSGRSLYVHTVVLLLGIQHTCMNSSLLAEEYPFCFPLIYSVHFSLSSFFLCCFCFWITPGCAQVSALTLQGWAESMWWGLSPGGSPARQAAASVPSLLPHLGDASLSRVGLSISLCSEQDQRKNVCARVLKKFMVEQIVLSIIFSS